MISRNFRVLLHDPLTIRLRDEGALEALLEALDMRVGTCGFSIRVKDKGADEWGFLKTLPGLVCTEVTGESYVGVCRIEKNYLPSLITEIVTKHLAGGSTASTSEWYFVVFGVLQGICEKFEIYLR